MKLKPLLVFLCCLSATLLPAQAIDPELTRTYDGEFNNPVRTDYGRAHTALVRYSGEGYADGQSVPAGPNRPNPRTISNALFAQEGLLNDPVGLSDYTWVFGQFIDHDLGLTEHPGEFMPIPVPAGDPQFDPFSFGTVMIPFTRNGPRFGTGVGIGNPRNYDNELTAFLDGSGVYGSDEVRATWLRSFEDGKMKVSEGDLLPYNTIDGEIDSPNDPLSPHMANGTGFQGPIFVAGDIRANENPLLAAFHTLFVREHNRQCDVLQVAHPEWNDEQLYQHARKMVGGLIQTVVYNEWLPAMGVPVEDYTGYDQTVNPQLSNVFTAAAFRVGHTLLNGNLRRLDANGNVLPEGNMTLREAFFNPVALVETGLDPFLRGMAEQTQQQMDSRVVDDVRNFLFGPPGAGGLDLAAINIARGRDRGLSSYNTIRRAYNLNIVFDFNQINPDFEVYRVLEELYENDINELDPWVAMLAERAVPGSIFGPTIRNIMATQFGNLRDGDRFFYLNDPVLTEEEKDDIHHTTFRDIIVRNTDVELMQENVFESMPFSEICGEQTVAADGIVRVHTTNEELANVTVSAWNSDGIVNSAVTTTELGFFNFAALPACQEISLTADLDDEWERGLNIFDMVAISAHLLGREPFTNPYQYFAADVTGDGEVNVFDIVSISRLLLARTTELRPAPTPPWMFIPAGYEFENPEDPLRESVPRSISFSRIDPADVNQGFVGIKLGDVNADTPTNNLIPGLHVDVAAARVTAGDRRLVEITISGEDVAGFQLELATDGLEIIGVAHTDLPAEAYRIDGDRLCLLGLTNGAATHKMILNVHASTTGDPADMFRIEEDEMAVAVDNAGTPHGITLGADAGAKEGLQASVFPNPFLETLTVRLPSALTAAATLDLLDVNGKQLTSKALPAGTEIANLSGLDLPAGAYVLRVTDAEGGILLARPVEAAGF